MENHSIINAIFILLGIATTAILIYFTWSYLTLVKLRKRNSGNDIFDNEKYYELKYKSEFLIAAFTLATGAFAFLGYNSLENIEYNIQKQFFNKTTELDSSYSSNKRNIDSLNSKASKMDSLVKQVNSTATLAEKKSSASRLVSEKIKKDQSSLEKTIASINDKNKLIDNFYIVKNQYYVRSDGEKNTYKFSELKTSSEDKLPEFSIAPAITVSSLSEIGFFVTDINTEHFSIQPDGRGDYKITPHDTFRFTVVIFH